MSQGLARLPLVLEVFALLFSNRWLEQWQKKWRAQKRLTRSGSCRQKPAQARFYERIFSLRVTLWYLIFQRLNFDQTQAAVVVNLREGGANRLGRRRAGPLSRRVRSTQTSAYNQARQRMPLALLSEALAHLQARSVATGGIDAGTPQAAGTGRADAPNIGRQHAGGVGEPAAGSGLSAGAQSKRTERLVAAADRSGLLRAQRRGPAVPWKGRCNGANRRWPGR